MMTTEQFSYEYLDLVVIAANRTNDLDNLVVLPDNAMYMGIQIGHPILELRDSKTTMLDNFGICGLLTEKKEYLCPVGSETLIVKFKCWSASLFLPNLHEIIDTNISMEEVYPKNAIQNLKEKFLASDDKKAVITQFLRERLRESTVDKSILHSLDVISRTNGQIRVDDLAYCVSNSRRNFERKFKAAIGISPKKFIKNTRFQNSLKQLLSNGDLTDIAYSCGYYDPSHFNNEFKQVTGSSPEKYILTNLAAKAKQLPELF